MPMCGRELTENCHRDLIASGTYSYQRFMGKFDEGLLEAGLELVIAERTAWQVSELLAGVEKSQLVKKVQVQLVEYQELLKNHLALQHQFMEQQRQLQQLPDLHPVLTPQSVLNHGSKIATLLGQRDFLTIKAHIANALLPYPTFCRLASSIMQFVKRFDRRLRNVL